MTKDRQELDELIDRYLEGKSTPEEQKYIDQWYASLGSRKATIAHGVERLTPETLQKIELRLKENISLHVRRSINIASGRSIFHMALQRRCCFNIYIDCGGNFPVFRWDI